MNQAVDEALLRLATCTTPLLVPVRHHSPACAVAVPKILEAFAPDRLFVELPHELETWLAWLGHAALVAPVALAAAHADGGLSFYPFADFSPELAAVRWAIARGVPIEAFDLPAADRLENKAKSNNDNESEPKKPARGILACLLEAEGTENVEALWDRLVEVRATREDPERLRRAALLFGWALRKDAHDDAGVPARDREREGYMRHRLALAGRERTAAIVGAFHASALLPEPELGEPAPYSPKNGAQSITTSLVPYAFELFDSRSGYPAGIRDPLWQQRAFHAMTEGASLEDVAREAIVLITREVRARGHVGGLPDAKEATRVAIDLARMRNLPGPGRREVLEAIESALGQGERFGRGRVLARALDRVLVGRKRGQLAPGTPRSGLAPHIEALVRALKLPGPEAQSEVETKLAFDPLRSPLDRRRHVALERLCACSVSYAVEDGPEGEVERLTTRWTARWSPATEATIELAGVRGITLKQAAEGALRAVFRKLEDGDGISAGARLVGLRAAAACGLADLARERMLELAGDFLAEASLADLVSALALVDRITRGHVPGLPPTWEDSSGEIDAFAAPPELRREHLLNAAVRAVEGLAGSARDDDARALLELVRLRGEIEDTGGRLGWALDGIAASGSPFMQGAAGAVRVVVARDDGEAFGRRVGSWIDGGEHLAARLRGAMLLAAPIFEGDPAFLSELVSRVSALSDEHFLARLPQLREGFDALSPAARTRLLDVLGETLRADTDPRGGALDVILESTPEEMARNITADRNAHQMLSALGYPLPSAEAATVTASQETSPTQARAPGSISAIDRFRLILGRAREKLGPRAAPMAAALDELYGSGRGEGARADLGGTRTQFPTVREWGRELEALFGERVREEVLGRAALRGRGAALVALNPERVQPSVELLEQMLALKGGLAEGQLAHLRKLVSRITAALVEELATRVRPALTGLSTPRPSRRRSGPLDLRRTIAANLDTARKGPLGEISLAPERLVFKTRAKRSLDWHVVLVVDISGSMEASVIYSAMMAAILSGMPAITAHFVAFNTEVVDLSDRVGDPLGLLLEVAVGGGTHIARALRYARELLRVPSRSLVVVVSDFEEGESVTELVAETRALVETGAKVLGLAALDDVGKPRYQRAIAELVVGAGMPVAALTPLELARWIGEQIR